MSLPTALVEPVWFADVVFYLFGFMAYLIPIMLGVWLMLFRRSPMRNLQPPSPAHVCPRDRVKLMLITASGLSPWGVPDGR
jgi:hypothetical protein